MSTNTPAFSKSDMQTSFTKQFTYDQLNRIKTAQVVGSTNSFGTAYRYDANGNIKTLERRNEAGVVFDQLSYNYHNVDKGYLKNTNKLRSVNDLVSTQEGGKALHGEDIEDQGIDNYSYDEIGNLIADESDGYRTYRMDSKR
jgi:YD repeat-containing protein